MAYRTKTHRPAWDSDAARTRRLQEDRYKYDQLRRDDPVRRFYNSRDWVMFRRKFLVSFPICKHCGGTANQVDHIKSVRSHWNLRFSPSNLQPLCQACHSKKTAYEGFAKPKRKINVQTFK